MMFALIDCNNFYASCERLFRPDLINRPIIVLSNNDGCAIARSNEAKALGIQMGEPFFKIKALCKEHNVAVFSSNYTLYGDLSARVMSIIENAWTDVEVYSIDEAFLNLHALPSEQHTIFCQSLQQHILKCIGIPTSIGIGKTKTRAKVANYIAKKRLKIPVFNIESLPSWLDKVPINEVWGVGRKWSKQLNAIGIYTASDLANAPPALIRKRFNVVLQRTAYELRGIACLELDEIEPNQSIISSKSFGIMQTECQYLEQAISAHVNRAWEKMRKQHIVASYLSVFVYSNRFRADLSQYNNSIGLKLIPPTDDLRVLTHYAKSCLKCIYKPGVSYKKAGVLFNGLVPKHPTQTALFYENREHKNQRTEQLMTSIERINTRFGPHTIKLAAEGYVKPWAMKQELKSPNYTTTWSDIPVVYCKHHKLNKITV